MDYHESADYLQSLQRRRPKLGTETTARMLSHLGSPQDAVDCVQVAGSNGKGSTARMLESVLRTAGLDVGTFTSPALTDFRDQIRINGRSVPKARVTEFVESIEPCIEQLRREEDTPTHFEVLTALALYHFGLEEVDVAVLEVGIGGRYDATSAVDPVASAVTSVSLEHTALLGETIGEIARDKAQVAPSERPLVTGATGAALEAIQDETETLTVGSTDADVLAVETGMRSALENELSLTGSEWAVETNLTLLGQHQATNAGVAATLAQQVATIDSSTIADGLRRTTWPGRFEIRSLEPLVVLDGAHNPAAMATLDDLLGRYDYQDLTVVFAAMSDKDHDRMAAQLPAVDTAIVTRPDTDRAADVDTLADAFAGHATEIRTIESVPEATERALAEADESDCVLVAGSLYAVSEARDRWTRTVRPRTAAPQLAGDTDDLVTGSEFDQRVFSTTLRTEQARILSEHLEAIGGACQLDETGAPEKFVSTVLSGTNDQLRELATSLAQAGDGLSRVGEQLVAALGAPSRPATLPTAGTAVMGILNVTPDSFHDGGEYEQLDAAVERAKGMIEAGADIIDVGGESTRPGAPPVGTGEEIDRVVPVIEAIRSLSVPIAVDTRKAAVADAALNAGADIVNDVSGLADPAMRFVVSDHDASLVITHSLPTPVDPGRSVTYDDIVGDVIADLQEKVLLAEQAGIERAQIIVDPGCGFGKDAAASFTLVDRLPELRALGCPIMLDNSRKSMFEVIGAENGDRLPPTVAVTTMATERGADVVRVHDVDENATAVRTVLETRPT